jgi:hypothetical protein
MPQVETQQKQEQWQPTTPTGYRKSTDPEELEAD